MLALAAFRPSSKRKTDLQRIEYLWPMLNRESQKHFIKDVDLASGRDRSDIYQLTSSCRLNADGELSRMRERWQLVSAQHREQLARQAEEAFTTR